MKRFGWLVTLGLSLIAASVALYLVQYAIFRDTHQLFIYLLADIAFLPIQVLLVTLVLNELLTEREKRNRLRKLNMIIGAFFSEMGTSLLAFLSNVDPRLGDIRRDLVVTGDWSPDEFAGVAQKLNGYDYRVEIDRADLDELRILLASRRDFLLGLLQNPNLLEHESFAELLRAVFHMAEELATREKIVDLPERDLELLANDMRRVYVLLVQQWLGYMRHLRDEYPYLFSLAMRTNPFDRDASPVVR
jgi:hypothetical protein